MNKVMDTLHKNCYSESSSYSFNLNSEAAHRAAFSLPDKRPNMRQEMELSGVIELDYNLAYEQAIRREMVDRQPHMPRPWKRGGSQAWPDVESLGNGCYITLPTPTDE